MAVDEESRAPLLGSDSQEIATETVNNDAEESTPLLSRNGSIPRYDGGEEDGAAITSPAASSLRSIQAGGLSKSKKGGKPWPTIIAVSTLATLVLVIIAGAFVAPTVVEEYAKQAVVIEPTSLSIHKFNANGVVARIQADFRLDAAKVQNENVRTIGRFGTWIAREIESQESTVEVYLPEYGNLLLGTAVIPKVVVNIRNGQTTHVDFLADLYAGDMESVRRLANDWLDGNLGDLRVRGKADVGLKSGFIPLGTQTISESLVFKGQDIPAMPQYNITSLNFHEVQLPGGNRGVAADVSISLINDYPVGLSIPPLGFDILVPNCKANEPNLLLADATTDTINVLPNSEVKIDVGGVVRQLPDAVTKACPHSHLSPLDLLLGNYIHGEDTTLFIRGSNAPSPETPDWVTKIMSSITVPIPFPGHSFDGAVRNFSMTDVHFTFPDLGADPGTPQSKPQVSGNIEVLAALPEEMNFAVNVSHIRANADVFYKGKKLGYLDLQKWQDATSEIIAPTEDQEAGIKIRSKIRDAPLNITDQNVFSDVISALIMGGKDVTLGIKALVDIEVTTVLGTLIIRDLPGEGNVPIEAPLKRGFDGLSPIVGELKIIETSSSSLTLTALVNVTNPTPYTARVPYFDVHILSNDSVIGHVTARDAYVGHGNITNLEVMAVWDPQTMGGEKGAAIARDLLSQYISGWNTTLTFRTHEGSIPSQPILGRGLSKLNITIPTPRLRTPSAGDGDDDDDDDGAGAPRFIEEAIFHLFSSTATFTLSSPLQENTLYIDSINATAFYNHTDPIGTIVHNLPFKVPPGLSTTPKLPVDWTLDSVGYEKVRAALGGELKLDAEATVGVRLGRWTQEIWYIGSGIGAKVRL